MPEGDGAATTAPAATFRDRIKSLRRVKAGSLRADPANWRRHPERQRSAMRAALSEIGFASALLARETPEGLTLIDGHLRADIDPDQKVPVLVLDVDEAEAAKLLATFDPIGAMAEADKDALASLVDGIEFDEIDIDDLLRGVIDRGSDVVEVPTPDPPDDPVTQPGDLYVLGAHRLLCGDSSIEADVDRLLDRAAIHLVNTDPPYNVKVEPRQGLGFDLDRHPGKAKPTSKMRAKDRQLVNDFVSDEEFDRLLLAWFGNMARVLVPGRGFYIWGGYANVANYPPAMKACGMYFSQSIIWDKQHPVLTRKDFMGAHEWCFYGWKEGAAHQWHGPMNATDLWAVKKVNPQSMVHLTEKPVELAVRAMQYSSRPGENVLDLFGGSGSTLIGAEQTGRRAFLMEIDPAYCDVIVERWETLTGEKAERETAPAPGGAGA